jgi:hypothetical protein
MYGLKRRIHRPIGVMATFISLLLLVAPEAAGQVDPGEGGGEGGSCGIDCVFCTGSPNHWIGTGSCSQCHGTGYATNYCRSGSCLTCNFLSEGEAHEIQVVVDRLVEAEPGGLSAVVADVGSRILVHQARGLVVVLGGCNDRALQAVVFLAPAKIQELEQLGVRTLSAFLAEVNVGRDAGRSLGS